ncbi:hypothetical protein ACIRST_41990 [Kitasatospora sp. NPDC101447]|uniref:hypothetical protein n=1 Tax=Kitasatospora sp. NPDC101447 TaxID=3364102 RepID=UPI003809AEFE
MEEDEDEWAEYWDPDDDRPLRTCNECGWNWGHGPGYDIARQEAGDWPQRPPAVKGPRCPPLPRAGAVRDVTLATAPALRTGWDGPAVEAYRRIAAAWTAAGIRH